MQVKLTLIALFTVALSSCTKTLDKPEYYNYFNAFQEGSYIELVDNDFVYQLQHRPAKFRALVELRKEEHFDKLDSVAEEYSQSSQYVIRISHKDDPDILGANIQDAAFFKRIELLSSKFPMMVDFEFSNDTLPPSFHHFERSYKLRPFVQVLFDQRSLENPNSIAFHDYIFQNGKTIRFEGINTLISSHPKLLK